VLKLLAGRKNIDIYDYEVPDRVHSITDAHTSGVTNVVGVFHCLWLVIFTFFFFAFVTFLLCWILILVFLFIVLPMLICSLAGW
jgi:energy-converting hydrogenase Eha subunit G